MRSLLRRIDRNTLTLSAGVLLAFGLLAMQRVPQLDLRQITARRLQLRLQQTPDAQVPELLARIAELDDAGLPRITAALGDDRPAIALAASDLLDRRLDRWTMLSVDESTPHLDQLAKSLAALAPSLGPNGRARAARIAERILLWPVDRNLINGAELVANCQQVLDSNRSSIATGRLEHDPALGLADEGNVQRPRPIDTGPIQLPPAAMNSPIELAEVPVLDAPQPRFVPGGLNSDAVKTATGGAVGEAAKPFDAAIGATRVNVKPANEVTRRDLDAIAHLPDAEVMRLLHHQSQKLAVAAIDELKRRGFQARHLRLARRLTDSSPEVRHELVSDLLHAPDVDARPWLAQLTRDPDAKVREAAEQAMPQSEPETYRDRLRRIKAEQDAKTARRF